MRTLFQMDERTRQPGAYGFFYDTDVTVFADSAYAGQEIREKIRAEICEKGYRNHPLTEEQKAP